MSSNFKSGALCAVVLSALVVGCGVSDDDAAGFGIFNALDPDQVGTWTGPWVNTTFNTAGTVTLIVSGGGGIGSTLTFTLDMRGDVFGLGDPAPEVFTAEINLLDADLDAAVSVLYGTLAGNLSAINVLTLAGTSVSSGSVTGYTAIGGWSDTTLTVNITLTTGSGDFLADAGAVLTKT